ncbi:hypothetical protein GGX14DRAFT_555970 [Mycena pura]|uniref:Uncharacterized protein n=1 Tax=Mycena pura TaxID=153505 RepID=A0AAD7E4V5_9AGAR|nr:hypothetical protein GGX14DRAFT_555970 [Mycena pura]
MRAGAAACKWTPEETLNGGGSTRRLAGKSHTDEGARQHDAIQGPWLIVHVSSIAFSHIGQSGEFRNVALPQAFAAQARRVGSDGGFIAIHLRLAGQSWYNTRNGQDDGTFFWPSFYSRSAGTFLSFRGVEHENELTDEAYSCASGAFGTSLSEIAARMQVAVARDCVWGCARAPVLHSRYVACWLDYSRRLMMAAVLASARLHGLCLPLEHSQRRTFPKAIFDRHLVRFWPPYAPPLRLLVNAEPASYGSRAPSKFESALDSVSSRLCPRFPPNPRESTCIQLRPHAFRDESFESFGDSFGLGGVMYGEFRFRTCTRKMIGECVALLSIRPGFICLVVHHDVAFLGHEVQQLRRGWSPNVSIDLVAVCRRLFALMLLWGRLVAFAYTPRITISFAARAAAVMLTRASLFPPRSISRFRYLSGLHAGGIEDCALSVAEPHIVSKVVESSDG